ncbi:hypothetical protein NQ314_013624 [Rhamnusium bicolor]|uniref:PiggyBac transposable element-derived protein domain-containing protein n=1 Tax=Rhamnusium bicolor TaxID=1586634 RepID=A0AAV8X5M3_9CUCU|nr:hypothetical protein NQ314_013624 [Rhamnusium bicolor]
MLTKVRLCKPLRNNSHRDITADNWFTSIELVGEMRKRGLTYVGTMKKIKREVPQEFLPSKVRQLRSTLYGFSTDKVTLIPHVPKKNKAVLLVSSMHHGKYTDPKKRVA